MAAKSRIRVLGTPFIDQSSSARIPRYPESGRLFKGGTSFSVDITISGENPRPGDRGSVIAAYVGGPYVGYRWCSHALTEYGQLEGGYGGSGCYCRINGGVSGIASIEVLEGGSNYMYDPQSYAQMFSLLSFNYPSVYSNEEEYADAYVTGTVENDVITSVTLTYGPERTITNVYTYDGECRIEIGYISITRDEETDEIISTRIYPVAHHFRTDQMVRIEDVLGSTTVNNDWKVTVIDDHTFSIPLTTIEQYVSGGTAKAFPGGSNYRVGDIVNCWIDTAPSTEEALRTFVQVLEIGAFVPPTDVVLPTITVSDIKTNEATLTLDATMASTAEETFILTHWQWQVSTDPNFGGIPMLFTTGVGVSGRSIVTTLLQPFTRYYYRIRAQNSEGYSDWGETGTFITVYGLLPPIVKTASSVTYRSAIANWENQMAITDSLYIDVSISPTFDTYVYENVSLSLRTSWLISGLSPRTTYYIRMRSKVGANTSGNSNVISFKTAIKIIGGAG